MDLIVPPLARLMPLDLAGKLFLVMIFAVMAGGAAALNRVLHGRWSLWSLAVFVMLYNRILLWGFLNYLFGVGLALAALAFWLSAMHWPVWRRVLVSSIWRSRSISAISPLSVSMCCCWPAPRSLRSSGWSAGCHGAPLPDG